MLQRSVIQRVLPILRRNARRALKMRVQGFPSPYYCSFLLKDFETFVTSAGSGSLYKRKHDRERMVFNDLRVGSYRYDQTTEGGLTDNNTEAESHGYTAVPIDDQNYDGLSLALWRLSECKYREAVSDYNHKNALRLSLVDQNSDLRSFVQLQPSKKIFFETPEKIDYRRWEALCKSISAWLAQLPGIFDCSVEFESEQASSVFVSSEGSSIVQHRQIFTLSANLRHLKKDGSQMTQELVINASSQKELPTIRELKKRLLEKHQKLQLLIRAKRIHSFSGPVLLFPKPAGLLLHEAIGHRLEGSRLLSTGEGQTFKGQIGKRILPVDITIIDDPRLKKFESTKCTASYEFDDEGAPGQRTVLVEKGILKNFLSTRAALQKKSFIPNGHARNRGFERPISRMSVFSVHGERVYSEAQMRELLIREIKKQKAPFGMIVYDTAGGETGTSSYDFQAFSGEISYATLLFPDGNEVPVRGVNFVGTPLQALANIIAIGDTQELENHFCGAESGFIPVSTISPSILIKALELQAKDEELVTQHILPKPKRYRKRTPRS